MVSYAMYLYHATLLAWLEDHGGARIFPPNHYIGLALSTLTMTVAVSAGSWYIVERPALRLKKLLPARHACARSAGRRRPRRRAPAPERARRRSPPAHEVAREAP